MVGRLQRHVFGSVHHDTVTDTVIGGLCSDAAS